MKIINEYIENLILIQEFKHFLFEESGLQKFFEKHGIKPEKADPSDSVCSIGFSEKEQKWYGWSHRAIHGFKIGDVVRKGDCCSSSGYTDEYLESHPEDDISLPVGFKAKTLEDAKKMAISFADSVS